MKLIIGLGNPGRTYAKTRHNAGFMVIDKMMEKLNATDIQKKFKGEYVITFVKGTKVILLKPQTYMNNSGECVRDIMGYYDIDIEDILVIYDDLDLPVGKIRLREKGSAGGQNGVKSIIQHCKTSEFNRIRIGIGRDPLYTTADYVLSKVSKEELPLFNTKIEAAAEAAIASINEPFNLVMGKYNGG